MYLVKGSARKDFIVDLPNKEILRVIKEAYISKFKKRLDIEVQDGFLMQWECTSYHNNDWEWCKSSPATDEEIERYAFWSQIKELFVEEK